MVTYTTSFNQHLDIILNYQNTNKTILLNSSIQLVQLLSELSPNQTIEK